jgi:hypothetical protein
MQGEHMPNYLPFPDEPDHHDPVQKDAARALCEVLLPSYGAEGASEADLVEDGVNDVLVGEAIELLTAEGAVEICGEGHDGEPRFRWIK